MNNSRRVGGRAAKENLSYSSVMTSQHEDVDMKPTAIAQFSQSDIPATFNMSIFLSPVDVLSSSLDDSNKERITIHDLVDAYSVMASALKTIILQNRNTETSFIDIGPIKSCLSLFVCAMRRDVKRVLYSPFNEDEISTNGLTSRQIRCAKDLSILSHHALRVLSQLLSFRFFLPTFKIKQLTSFYDDILTILQANSLPTPNPSRTHGLLLWILQTQQLPASILVSRKERLQRVVSEALDGAFGREQFQADGLKIIASHLRRPEKELHQLFSDCFNTTLSLLCSPTPYLRLRAADTLSAFAFAKLTNLTDDAPLSHALQRFLASGENTLKPFLKNALTCKTPSHYSEGPIWACVVLASLIILIDRSIFGNDTLIGPLAKLLELGSKHDRQAICVLSHRLWNCLVWTFSRVQLNSQNEKMWRQVLGFIQQAPGHGTGHALAYVLGTIAPSDDVEATAYITDILDTIDMMLKSKYESTQAEGEELLARLLHALRDLEPLPTLLDTSVILARELFDGKLIDLGLKNLDNVVESMAPVSLSYVRPLTDQEILYHWDELLRLWTIIIRRILKKKNPDFPRKLMDMYQQLLLVKSQLSQGRFHLAANMALIDEADAIAVDFIHTNVSEDRQLIQIQLVRQLWHTTTLVFNDETLVHASKSMLHAVVPKFRIEQEIVMNSFLSLYQELRPDTQDWTFVARSLQGRGCNWDALTAFGRCASIHNLANADNIETWVRLVREARLPADATVHALWVGLQTEAGDKPSLYPELIYPLFLAIDLSRPPSKDQEILHDMLMVLYPPTVENMQLSLAYVALAGQIVASIAIDDVVSFLSMCSPCFTLWFEDKSKSIADADYNRVIVPLYSRIIERLEHLEPTAEIIANLGNMLVSPMGRCPAPGTTSDDFQRYWTATYHHRKAKFYSHYPDELKRCLRDFEMVYGWKLAEGFSQTTNSQVQVKQSDNAPVDRLSVQNPEYIVPETPPSQLNDFEYINGGDLYTGMDVDVAVGAAKVGLLQLQRNESQDSDVFPSTSSPPSARKRKSLTDHAVPPPKAAHTSSPSQGTRATTLSRKKRKTMVLDCVQIPMRHAQATFESQLMTPDPSRPNSTSPFRTALLSQGQEEEEDFSWEDGNVSISDVRELQLDAKKEPALASDSNISSSQPKRSVKCHTEPVLTSPSVRASPMRRTKTTSASLLELQRVYQTFTEARGTLPIEELRQASKLVSSLRAAIDEQLERQREPS
ncbi:hypothetical protein VNI00_002714 [Paramarasmius palmivorus]|uniref:Telomere-associated protein Rif1 N-terminal domain-containing protein n=1 Tax=Paramarasmius palmivorus TaxID=297713 RepID=A0AAW0DVZ6_9AGAR